MENSAVSYRVFTEHETSRMLFEGAVNADISTVFSNSEEEGDWIEQWRTLANEEAGVAASAEKNNYTEAAFQSYFRAANYYRLAQYHTLTDTNNIKRDNLSESYVYYNKAIALKPESYQKFPVEYNSQVFNGYLHFPPQFKKDSGYPCVIVTPGLGHNRESVHNFCQVGAKIGFVVVAIDGPGYGESVAFQGIKLKTGEYHEFILAVTEALRGTGFIDANRIGLFGDCFGAYLSFKVASELESIKACVMVEGILEYGDHQLRDKPLPPILTYHVHPDEHAAIQEMYKDFFTDPSKHKFSLYMIHARIDHLIPFESAQKVMDHFSGDKHLEVVEGNQVYQNYLTNHYNPVLDQLEKQIPKAWDWLKNKV